MRHFNTKSVLDYLRPHQNEEIGQAFDNAKNDYRNEREEKLIILCYQNGITTSKIAKALEVDISVISHKYPRTLAKEESK